MHLKDIKNKKIREYQIIFSPIFFRIFLYILITIFYYYFMQINSPLGIKWRPYHFERVVNAIENIYDQLESITLDEAVFPSIENPLMPIMEDTPVTQTSLNLPSIDQSMMTQSQAANQFSNLTMDQKIRLLFPNG